MDEENMKSWVSQPDVCRCCLSTSGTWDLTASYITDAGFKEVFSDLLQECYGVSMSHLSDWGPSHLICELCVIHLRGACSFRKQVLYAEQFFMEYWKSNKESAIKNELEAISPDDFNDLGDASDDDDENRNKYKNHTNDINVTDIHTKKLMRRCSKRKRQKSNPKAKQKRKEIKLSDDDSDTPIAELSRKIAPLDLQVKTDNNTEIRKKELAADKTKIKALRNKDGTAIQEKPKRDKKRPKAPAQSHLDNKHLRSNITLLLKHSTILPFKHTYKNKFICLYCDNSYIFFKELKEHVSESHKEISEKEITDSLKTPKDLIKGDISEIKCKLCKEDCKTVPKLIEHLIDVHNKIYYITPRIKPSHGILGFDLSSEKLKCHICNIEFRFFKNLSIHMNEHNGHFICEVCGKKFVSDHRLQGHIIIHKKADIFCKHCNKEFNTVPAKNYHIRKVHNETKFKCSECVEIFTQYQHRLDHLVQVHKIKKPDFKCDICCKEFARSGSLRAHVRYSHLKNTEYPCDTCGKVFLYKWIWKSHMEVHSGKKYDCEYCEKKFTKPYSLRVHLRIHLNDRRFKCEVCKTAFIQKNSLKRHIRVHHFHSGIDLNKL